MEETEKIDFRDISFKFTVETKFNVQGRGIFVGGRINLGSVSTDDEVIICDHMGFIKGRTSVTVEIFSASKMKNKHIAFEPMVISLLLEDIVVANKVEINDYIMML